MVLRLGMVMRLGMVLRLGMVTTCLHKVTTCLPRFLACWVWARSDLSVFQEIIVYFDWLTWLRFREDVKNILMGGPHYLGRLVTIFTIFRGGPHQV